MGKAIFVEDHCKDLYRTPVKLVKPVKICPHPPRNPIVVLRMERSNLAGEEDTTPTPQFRFTLPALAGDEGSTSREFLF